MGGQPAVHAKYVCDPSPALMVKGYVPAGVDIEVSTVIVDWNPGAPEPGLKLAVAPAGSPVT